MQVQCGVRAAELPCKLEIAVLALIHSQYLRPGSCGDAAVVRRMATAVHMIAIPMRLPMRLPKSSPEINKVTTAQSESSVLVSTKSCNFSFSLATPPPPTYIQRIYRTIARLRLWRALAATPALLSALRYPYQSRPSVRSMQAACSPARQIHSPAAQPRLLPRANDLRGRRQSRWGCHSPQRGSAWGPHGRHSRHLRYLGTSLQQNQHTVSELRRRQMRGGKAVQFRHTVLWPSCATRERTRGAYAQNAPWATWAKTASLTAGWR